MVAMNKYSSVLVKNFLIIGACLHRLGDKIVSEFSINQQQFVVLNEIQRAGETCQKNLVGSLLYEKSNISKIISKLQSLGYVTVTRSATDTRVTIVKTTELGENIWAKCMAKFYSWNQEWVNSITQEDVMLIINAQERLMDALQKNNEPGTEV
ncbi:transcriptional regulator, MarR family [Geotalea uraniireducens Rf4]|uniref:HTH-type transcriptional regulator SarZ n=2 Tax=Geotalea uraniireducens TaxID=351604 RepID=A5G4J4_GEOUR|nr:transcriptional regulator, MarR family [Geotalea uraniireducens Rf4]